MLKLHGAKFWSDRTQEIDHCFEVDGSRKLAAGGTAAQLSLWKGTHLNCDALSLDELVQEMANQTWWSMQDKGYYVSSSNERDINVRNCMTGLKHMAGVHGVALKRRAGAVCFAVLRV